MAETNYDINYDDKRFTQVESDKTEALSEIEKTYGGMINDSEKYFTDQIDASKQWAETQKQNQQAQTDFAIEKIEQQKAQAQKDYTKEQSGAYVDYQKATGAYGAEAEQMAAGGLTGTGFAESSQTAKYVAYQNRVATARESYTRAVLNYDNAIKDAQLQNNSVLAEIAYNALKEQLSLSLEGFKYKNSLVLEKAAKKTEAENTYYGRYKDVLNQINQENALAEEVRQYNASLALEREKFNWQKEQASKSSPVGGDNYVKGDNDGNDNKDTDAQIKDTNKEEIKEESNEKDLPVDTSSLVAAGLAGASASKIAAEIAAGRLVETVENGKLTYRRVFNGGASGRDFISTPAPSTSSSLSSSLLKAKTTSNTSRNRSVLKSKLLK